MSILKTLGVDAIGNVISLAGDWLNARAERKRIEIEAKTDVARMKAETVAVVTRTQVETAADMAKTGQRAEIDWDMLQAESSKGSFRDEVMMIAILWPYVGAFIPGMRQHVQDGFATLEALPDWYIISFGTVLAASFGYRALVKHFIRPPRA